MKYFFITVFSLLFILNLQASNSLEIHRIAVSTDTLLIKQWIGEFSPEIGCEGLSAGSTTVKISLDSKGQLVAIYSSRGFWQGESWNIKVKCFVVKDKDLIKLYRLKSGKKKLLFMLRFLDGIFEYYVDSHKNWCALEMA